MDLSPPTAPHHPTKFRLYPFQWIGLAILIAILLLGFTGVLPTEHSPAANIIWRVSCIYVFLIAALRIMGKREFNQMAPFEVITLLIIPEIVSPALTNGDNSISGALVGVATLLILVLATSTLAYLNRRFYHIVEGKAIVIVAHGKLIEERLHYERVTSYEIFEEMHKVGLERLEQVKWAILENDGKITIIPCKEE